MILTRNLVRAASAALASACLAGPVFGQGANPTASFTGADYVQNFDILRQNNAASNVIPAILNRADIAPFTEQPTPNSLQGLRFRTTSATPTFRRDDGSNATGAGYSYGNAFNDNEAAFGVLTSGTFTGTTFGLIIRNLSGVAQSSVTVQYTGEQWRFGGPRANSEADRLDVRYLLGSNELIGTAAGTAAPGLTFNAPVVTGTAGPLDGNAAPNRVTLTQTINFVSEVWDPNEDLAITFFDVNATGADDGLAIDNLRVFIVPVPEPAGLLAAAVAAGVARAARRRRSP